MQFVEGKIIKGIGGFYYVSHGDEIIECKARGIFRKRGITPKVGDNVMIKPTGDSFIEEIFPRENELIRPAVANVTQIVLVVASRFPEPNILYIDTLIGTAKLISLKLILCVNKSDICKNELIFDVFCNSGCEMIYTSAVAGEGIEKLKNKLAGQVTVFAGNSGVGKSSIINLVSPNSFLKTGDISKKVERGKHTTRHTELIKIQNEGYIIDTPGFSTIALDNVKPDELAFLYDEFKPYIDNCKFTGCSHTKEIGCEVINAVKMNSIHPVRFENYLTLYQRAKKNSCKW